MTITLELTPRQLEVISSLVNRALEVKDLFKNEISIGELRELDEMINECFFNEMDEESNKASKKK